MQGAFAHQYEYPEYENEWGIDIPDVEDERGVQWEVGSDLTMPFRCI